MSGAIGVPYLRQRAADEALARALRHLHELLRIAVLGALAGARMGGTRAVVLAGLRDAIALLAAGIVGGGGGDGAEREQAAECSSNEGRLGLHRSIS
jgi:hypothetical protein